MDQREGERAASRQEDRPAGGEGRGVYSVIVFSHTGAGRRGRAVGVLWRPIERDKTFTASCPVSFYFAESRLHPLLLL
jgi:hypothetical protein